MSDISPKTPSFYLGYWRPWKEDANLFNSYLDYLKDVSLVKYNADTIGKYINQASEEHLRSISNLGASIGRGMNMLSNQLNHVVESLDFLNKKLDISIEQQKLSNVLLQDIATLLCVPNSEKERQQSINLGVKFFVNAKNDKDLYSDAMEEFLKAENLMKQDYFVLHKIGCIYLYVEEFINPELALSYFTRAAKYASVDNGSDIEYLKSIASDSYEKAAFCAYVLGQFEMAVHNQTKAAKLDSRPEKSFLLSKYQARIGNIQEAINNLEISIDNKPELIDGVFSEIDLANEILIIKFIETKNATSNRLIDELIQDYNNTNFLDKANIIKKLNQIKTFPYQLKLKEYKTLENELELLVSQIKNQQIEIDLLIEKVKKSVFCTFDKDKIETIIYSLSESKMLPLETMKSNFQILKNEIDNDLLKIGAKYKGGIVFFIDKSQIHGLVCAENELEELPWSRYYFALGNTSESIGSGYNNTRIIVEKASSEKDESFLGLFSKNETPIRTAARACKELTLNGYSDWFLPSYMELELILNNLHKKRIHNFSKEVYWSSSEHGEAFPLYARYITFNERLRSSSGENFHKGYHKGVIPIRTF
jgi:hypothetical protein